LIGLAFRFRCSLCSINSLGTLGMSAGFHAKMFLLFWRNLSSASSYLGSKGCLREFRFDGHLGVLGLGHDRVRGGGGLS
jgi:hypothetical protein